MRLAPLAVLALVAPALAQLPDLSDLSRPQPATAPAGGAAVALDAEPFVSNESAISVRVPTDARRVPVPPGEEIARFLAPEERVAAGQGYQLSLRRVEPQTETPLVDQPAPRPDLRPVAGFLNNVRASLRREAGDARAPMLRDELVPLAGVDGALLAVRAGGADDGRLVQVAVLRRTARLFYVLTLATPVGPGEVEDDQQAVAAAELFAQIVDGVQLLDRGAVRLDQEERLTRTRGLMVHWTEAELRRVLVPRQWLRLVRGGRDVGYTFVSEEPADDLPRGDGDPVADAAPAVVGVGKVTGVRVGTRTRLYPPRVAPAAAEPNAPGAPPASRVVQVDAEAWLWAAFDRERETFGTKVQSLTDANAARWTQEVGGSSKVTKVAADPRVEAGPNPGTRAREVYELDVRTSTDAGGPPPVELELPPYYVPRAVAHLLPRLVPLDEPTGYLVGAYVQEGRAPMFRYLDVKRPADATVLGRRHPAATAVVDRIGLDGLPATHYFDSSGKYVGTVDEAADLTIVPAEEAELEQIWGALGQGRVGAAQGR